MHIGKEILITGASSHLGQALVNIAISRGHSVIACSRREVSAAVDPAQALARLGGLDLCQDRALAIMRDKVGEQFSGPFSVINCMGHFPGYVDIAELSQTGARQVMESNFLSLYGVANVLLPLMLQYGGGEFISFSAHSQYQCYPKMAAFNSAKAAVEALTVSLSNEYLRFGVRANCFALATMLTPEEQQMKPKGDHERWLLPAEVALRTIEHLERADPIVSGNVIQLFKHSESYFGQSYLSRIER
jgi:NAD(P)-dependent dehydrogenase (short-subunit alcohol dehydrogenase family)